MGTNDKEDITPVDKQRGRNTSGIIDAFTTRRRLIGPEPELNMIARPTEVTDQAAPNTASSAETPLQRQILLWQHELLRRAELRRSTGPAAKAVESFEMESEVDPEE
jgi:hypothetical protein